MRLLPLPEPPRAARLFRSLPAWFPWPLRALTLSFLFLPIAIVLTAHFAHAAALPAQNPDQLKAQGYVNDYANVLSPSARLQLTSLCAEVEQKAQAQIAVVTVKSLGGRPIEDYSLDVATRLGVGPKKSDRGVMILLAVDDHKYRFEVGYGLEGILPDGRVGSFGRQAVPFLRQNNYDAALLLMTHDVADVIAADRGVTLTPWSESPAAVNSSRPLSLPPAFLAFGALLLLFLIFRVVGRMFGGSRGSYRRGGGWWIGPTMGGFGGGGGWGGGGWGGGGGGGGFGGFGGGSFGGGGASGSW